MLIEQIEISRLKSGGSALEVINITIPSNVVRFKWGSTHKGAIPIVNFAVVKFNVKTAADTFTGEGGAFFNIGGAVIDTVSLGENFATAGDQIKYVIQANAITTTNFFLRIIFLDN